jgi:hypothetical protein
VLIKFLFALSCAAMTLLLSQGGSLLYIGAGVLLSLIICVIIAFRFQLPESILIEIKPVPAILGAILSIFVATNYQPVFSETTQEVITPLLVSSPMSFLADAVQAALPITVCVVSLFALFVWFYFLSERSIRFVQRWFISSCFSERLYLLIGFLFASAAIVLVFGRTTAFTGAEPYDVVFTTDSGNLMSTNSFLFVNAYENDIRQPLFAVFSMPFSAIAMLLSKPLFFMTNAYPVLLACMQALLLLFSYTLLARVLALTGAERILFLVILALSYPTLLFLFTIEQYVFSVFWVLVFIYSWYEKQGNRTLLFVAATGSLLTSGVFFPLLLDGKYPRQHLRALFRAGLAFIAVFVVFGRVPLLNRAIQTMQDLLSFAGDRVNICTRILQFLTFVSSCFVRPPAGIDLHSYPHASYQLFDTPILPWFGLVVITLVALSAILHRKEAKMRVFSLWVGFSIVLLMLVGWGAAENGMVLYTLYFFWAFAALLYALLKTFFLQNRFLRCIFAAACIAVLVCVNLPGIIDLLHFAITYYPAT